MPGLYDISSNVANVAVSNTPGLYIGSGASSILNNAQQLLALLSNQGNVNFALASGNTTVQGFFIGNTSVYSNANVAAYLPINTSNVAGTYFFGDGSNLTNLPVQAGTYTNANVAAFLPTFDGNIGQPGDRPYFVYSSFFVGDGSGLINLPDTGNYGNANVAAFLPVNTSNVAATYFLGDGSQLTNLPIPGVYGNANVAAYLLTSTGNISAGYFLGDGSQLTNLPAGNYGNANVAAYLPTYTGTLDNSSTVVTLFANAASQALDINTLYNAIAIANNNQIAANITISNLDANVGAFETYANATFGTSNYGNANVAAYLPTYTGTLAQSSTIVDLYSNAAAQAAAITTIDANLGTATTNITTLFSNAATQATSINTLDANLGAATTNITTLFSNAATQAGQIDTLNANLGAFETYANATFGTSSYSNVQVAAFLPTYTGDIGNTNVKTGSQNWYGGTMTVQANAATAAGGTLNLRAGNVSNSVGGTINVSAANITLGGDYYATDLLQVQMRTRFGPLSTGTAGANIATFAQGNVVISNKGITTGNPTIYGGHLFVDNGVRAGSLITTDGVFWANGNAYSTGDSTYGNTQVAAYLPTYTGQFGGNLTDALQPGISQIGPNPNSGSGGAMSVSGAALTANANVITFNSGFGTSSLTQGSINFNSYNTSGGNTGQINFSTGEFNVSASDVIDLTGPVTIRGNLNIANSGTGGWLLNGTGGIITDVIQSNTITVSGNVNAAYFAGDGSGLTNVSPWGDYQGSGFQSIQADSALLTFNSLGAIASGNLTNGIGSIVGTLNDPNWADGPYAFLSGQASNYYDGSANQPSIIIPRSGVSANTSVVNGAQWSTTWGNILILPQGTTTQEIYEFSNIGIRFPDGTVQSTAASGGGTYGNTQVLANLAANSTQTTAWSIPFGSNAARPSAAFAGMIRYNTDYNVPEWYSNVAAAWYAFSNPVNPSPPAAPSMWYLAVAGGGGGGSRIGAGGGAGGYLTGNATIASGTTYTITVGAGGAAVSSTPGVVGNDGGNTSISGSGLSTITAVGGGGGGAYISTNGTAGRNGGSGGGGSYSGNGGVNTPGSGTSGQGSQGGAGSATNVSGGGGGGASAVGQAAQSSAGGNGGAGSYNLITGANVAYAGGGGGSQAGTPGTGGVGGGGAGSAVNNNATAGTNYLGGGGGGARNDSDTTNVFSGKGGDGVCIIRIATASYSGTYTGSNVAVSTSGSDTILKFSASGTYTA